jgi:hypothetical protein
MEKKAGWAPEPVWTFCKREKSGFVVICRYFAGAHILFINMFLKFVA